MTLSAETVAAILGPILLAAAVAVLRRRRRTERAFRARLASRPTEWDCLECGAPYRAGELFCQACGAWPGQTG